MKNANAGVVEVAKSVGLSVVFTLAAVLVFALVIKLCSLGSSVIMPVNQVIKYLAIFLGCFFCIRSQKRIAKGAISGFCVALLTYFIFAAIAGSISFGWSNIIDFICCALAGAISGAIAGLVRSKD